MQRGIVIKLRTEKTQTLKEYIAVKSVMNMKKGARLVMNSYIFVIFYKQGQANKNICVSCLYKSHDNPTAIAYRLYFPQRILR